MANDNGNRQSPLLELAALWPRTRTDQGTGEVTTLKGLQGKLGNVRILILPNDKPDRGPKEPTFRMFLAPPIQQQRQRREPGDDDGGGL